MLFLKMYLLSKNPQKEVSTLIRFQWCKLLIIVIKQESAFLFFFLYLVISKKVNIENIDMSICIQIQTHIYNSLKLFTFLTRIVKYDLITDIIVMISSVCSQLINFNLKFDYN